MSTPSEPLSPQLHPHNDYQKCLSEFHQSRGITWYKLIRRFQRKAMAVETNCLTLFCALYINFNYIYYDVFNKMDEMFTIQHDSYEIIIVALWYVGVIFGCIICGTNQYTWPAKRTNFIMAMTLLISGTLICVHDFIWSQTEILIAIARFLAGCCYGFAYITTTVLIGDNIWRMIRGSIGIIISAQAVFAFLLAVVYKEYLPTVAFGEYAHTKRARYDPMTDIILILSILLIACSIRRLSFEPLTWLLKQNKIDEAREIFIDLCDMILSSEEIQNEMNDKVKMMSEDYEESDGIFAFLRNGNWKPLSWMTLLRILNVWTFNLFLLAMSAFSITSQFGSLVQPAIFLLRLLSVIPAKYLCDRIGRKYLLLISGIGTSFCSIPLALHLSGNKDLSILLLGTGCILLNAFASFGIEPMTHVYSIEAFPLSKRNASVAFLICFEYFCHGMIMVLWLNNCITPLHIMIMLMPFFVIFITLVLFIGLPETMGKTLRECRAEFNSYYMN